MVTTRGHPARGSRYSSSGHPARGGSSSTSTRTSDRKLESQARLSRSPRDKPSSGGSTTTTRSSGATSGGGGTTTSGGGTSGGGGGTASQPGPDIQELRESIRATPLDPDLVAEFNQRERSAERSVESAKVEAQRAKEQAASDFDQFLRQLNEQTDTARSDLRQEAAARNLAFQPAFVGTGERDIRNQAAETTTEAQDERAQFLQGIDRQINEAQQERDTELAAIERERARARADHENFIQQQLNALSSG